MLHQVYTNATVYCMEYGGPARPMTTRICPCVVHTTGLDCSHLIDHVGMWQYTPPYKNRVQSTILFYSILFFVYVYVYVYININTLLVTTPLGIKWQSCLSMY